MASIIPGGYGNATGANSSGINNPMSEVVTKRPEDFGLNFLGAGSTTPATLNSSLASNIPGAAANPLASVGTDNVVPTAAPAGGTNTSDVSGLNLASSLGWDPSVLSELQKTYGPIGTVLSNFFGSGAGYNPQVAKSLMDAMQPYADRSRANILESFGAGGNRQSSPAAIGLGDFNSNFALGQNQILANLANDATNRYSGLLGGVLDTAHLEQANKTSAWDVISGLLGIGNAASGAGGIAGQIANLIKQLTQKGSSGGGGGGGGTAPSSSGNMIGDLINWIKNRGNNSGTGTIPNPITGSMPGGPQTGPGTQGGSIQDILNSIGIGAGPSVPGDVSTLFPINDPYSSGGSLQSLLGDPNSWISGPGGTSDSSISFDGTTLIGPDGFNNLDLSNIFGGMDLNSLIGGGAGSGLFDPITSGGAVDNSVISSDYFNSGLWDSSWDVPSTDYYGSYDYHTGDFGYGGSGYGG